MKYARYEVRGEIAYGLVEGSTVRQITAPPFEDGWSGVKGAPKVLA